MSYLVFARKFRPAHASPSSSGRSPWPDAPERHPGRARRPRLPVHRAARRGQDHHGPHPGQGPQLPSDGPTPDALRQLRRLPGHRRGRRHRRASRSTAPPTPASTTSASSATTLAFRPPAGRYKIYIIDEVHMLTDGGLQRPAQDARGAAAARQVHLRHHRACTRSRHHPLALPAVRLPPHPDRDIADHLAVICQTRSVDARAPPPLFPSPARPPGRCATP